MPCKYSQIRTDEQYLRYMMIMEELLVEVQKQPNPEKEVEIRTIMLLINLYHEWFYQELLENINLNEN